jgi:hypothetical protein
LSVLSIISSECNGLLPRKFIQTPYVGNLFTTVEAEATLPIYI